MNFYKLLDLGIKAEGTFKKIKLNRVHITNLSKYLQVVSKVLCVFYMKYISFKHLTFD